MRLRPIKHVGRSAVVAILASGQVQLTTGVETMLITPPTKMSIDSVELTTTTIRLMQPGAITLPTRFHSLSSRLFLPCVSFVPGVPDHSYMLNELPSQRLCNRYLYAQQFVAMVCSKTPKITYYSQHGRCQLMEPGGAEADFDYRGSDGSRTQKCRGVVHRHPATGLIETETEKMDTTAAATFRNAASALKFCWNFENRAGPACTFPVTLARRATSSTAADTTAISQPLTVMTGGFVAPLPATATTNSESLRHRPFHFFSNQYETSTSSLALPFCRAAQLVTGTWGILLPNHQVMMLFQDGCQLLLAPDGTASWRDAAGAPISHIPDAAKRLCAALDFLELLKSAPAK